MSLGTSQTALITLLGKHYNQVLIWSSLKLKLMSFSNTVTLGLANNASLKILGRKSFSEMLKETELIKSITRWDHGHCWRFKRNEHSSPSIELINSLNNNLEAVGEPQFPVTTATVAGGPKKLSVLETSGNIR